MYVRYLTSTTISACANHVDWHLRASALDASWTNMETPQPRIWLGAHSFHCLQPHKTQLIMSVTGASSGFGRAVAEVALRNNEIVSVAVRNPETVSDLRKYGPDRLLVSTCNVANAEQIANVFSATRNKFGHIDVVLHSAGYAILGEIEGTPEQTARDLFDVNFWGTANVGKEAVKTFREQGSGGRLLNLSSVSGQMGLAALGYYSAR